MDLNQSGRFQSSSSPVTQMHNFMHVPSPLVPRNQQQTNEVGEGSMHSRAMQLQKQNLQLFWHQQMLEIDQLSDFKQHQLPLARIKRIMKSDEDVKMISADAPVLFSKACELFILELTLRSWFHTEENRRRTLQRADIANAVNRGEVLDFLLDIVPMDDTHETKEEESGRNWEGTESHPSNGISMHFPVMEAHQFHQNLNGEFIRQQEIPQQFVIQAPMSPNQLIYENAPQ